MADGLVDVVRNSAEFDLTFFDDRVGGSWITITRLADTARIDHLSFLKLQLHRNVRMSDAHKIHIHMLKPLLPLFDVVAEVWRGRAENGDRQVSDTE